MANLNTLNPNDIIIRKYCINDITEILEIQEEVMRRIEGKNFFIKFSKLELENIMKHNGDFIGFYLNNNLIAVANLVIKNINDSKNLGFKIGINQITGEIDGCWVSPLYFGNGLQKYLIKCLEEIAKNKNIYHLIATVVPNNNYSLNNFIDLNYQIKGTCSTPLNNDTYILYKNTNQKED